MEHFLEVLLLIYNIVAGIAVMIYPFLCPEDQKENADRERETEEKWKSRFSFFMLILVLVTACILIIVSVFRRIIWIVVPITILMYLERTNQAYASLTVIRETINKKGVDALSKRETDAIIMLTTALMMFNLYKVPQRLVELSMKIPNEIVSDWVTLFVLILMITLISFLIGVLLILPFKAIVRLVKWIKSKNINRRISTLADKYKALQRMIVWDDFLSVRLIEWTLKKTSFMRIFWIILIITIPMDVCIKMVLFCFGTLSVMVEYPFIIIRRVGKTIARIVRWLSGISDRKVINIIFRIAFVISISLVVIVNRYDSFLHNIGAGTGILEFIASAIVIPMIFAWVIEYKEETNRNMEGFR